MPKIAIINSKHKKTLAAIFAKPDASNIKFADIEALVVALGGEVTEGDGSRVAMHLHGGVNHAHRPPPRARKPGDTRSTKCAPGCRR